MIRQLIKRTARMNMTNSKKRATGTVSIKNPDGSWAPIGQVLPVGQVIEKNVKQPRGIRKADPNSILSQLLALDLGATYSRADRLSVDATWEQIQAARKSLENTMTTQRARANKQNEMADTRFTMAIGEFRAGDGSTIVTVAVTRVSAASADSE